MQNPFLLGPLLRSIAIGETGLLGRGCCCSALSCPGKASGSPSPPPWTEEQDGEESADTASAGSRTERDVRTQQLLAQHGQLVPVEASLGDGRELPAQHLRELRPARTGRVQEEGQVLGRGQRVSSSPSARPQASDTPRLTGPRNGPCARPALPPGIQCSRPCPSLGNRDPRALRSLVAGHAPR